MSGKRGSNSRPSAWDPPTGGLPPDSDSYRNYREELLPLTLFSKLDIPEIKANGMQTYYLYGNSGIECKILLRYLVSV